MLANLKGGALWLSGGLVCAILASVTYLAASGAISGDAALGVITGALTGLTGVTAAHVAGQAVTNAAQVSQGPVPPTPAPPVSDLGKIPPPEG